MTLPCLPLDAPFEVRFADLVHKGRELVFPCDARGRVDLDTLSERAREDYFFARAMVGRGFSPPRVARSGCADHDESLEGDAAGRRRR